MLWGGTYRTAPELASRGKNFRFVQSWTDWVRQLAGGGPGGDRTHDLTDANRTLSQLSYGPIA